MKTALITGISRGIGLETAKYFLNQGWAIWGTSTSGSTPLSHPLLTCLPLDLKNEKNISDLVNLLPKIDLLINNAAVLLDKPKQPGIDITCLKDTFSINVYGTFQLTEKVIEKMNHQGQVVNLSSGWGSLEANDSPYMPHYKLSKVCLNMYTRLLAERLPTMVISSLDPGWVKTDMGSQKAPRLPAEVAKEIYDLVNTEKPSGHFWMRGKMRSW